MTSSVFPDINVWLALSYSAHTHHKVAASWYARLDTDVGMVFCRHTQLGLLRLLTTAEVMLGAPLTQPEAWRQYDRWADAGSVLLDEPPGLERSLRAQTSSKHATPKLWADAYLAAFASLAGVQLVTFDRALHLRTERSILLKS